MVFLVFLFCSSVAARARDRKRPPSPGVRVGPLLAIPSQFSSSLIDEICAPVSEFEGAELPGPRWRACLGASSVGVFSRFSPTGRARSTSSFPLFFLLFFLPSPPSSSPVPLPAPLPPKNPNQVLPAPQLADPGRGGRDGRRPRLLVARRAD